MSGPPARAVGLVKHYERAIAVDGVDLEIRGGEIHGLLGPNGAGKTTLLRMLFGLVAPDAGSIELFGRPLRASDNDPLEGVAGFVEEPAFYPALSATVNLELLAELDGAGARRRVAAVLDQVGLGRHVRDRVGCYSTGMRQRLGIAAALLRSPRLLLLDEPTSGLDPAGAREVAALLRDLSAQGTAVLLSSHLIGEIESICDRFTVLAHGHVVWSGTACELGAQAPASAYSLATSDDDRALEISERYPGVRASRSRTGELAIEAHQAQLDSYVLALGRQDVAIRRLEQQLSPLASVFFALTGEAPQPPTDLDHHREPALAHA